MTKKVSSLCFFLSAISLTTCAIGLLCTTLVLPESDLDTLCQKADVTDNTLNCFDSLDPNKMHHLAFYTETYNDCSADNRTSADTAIDNQALTLDDEYKDQWLFIKITLGIALGSCLLGILSTLGTDLLSTCKEKQSLSSYSYCSA